MQFLSFALVGWFYHIHGSGVAVLILVMSFVAGHAFGNGVACWVIIRRFIPRKFAAVACRSQPPRCGWSVTSATNYFPSCKSIGIGWNVLVFQRRRIADGDFGRVASAGNQRPFARRDHQTVDHGQIHHRGLKAVQFRRTARMRMLAPAIYDADLVVRVRFRE